MVLYVLADIKAIFSNYYLVWRVVASNVESYKNDLMDIINP